MGSSSDSDVGGFQEMIENLIKTKMPSEMKDLLGVESL